MTLELFFDYACPYCYKGHKNLLELLEDYKEMKIVWRPCEAHPRPENYSTHSDLAIQGMFYIQEHDGDIWKYHMLIYKAMFDHSLDISDISVLSSCAEQCNVSRNAFSNALKNNLYTEKVVQGNQYAWDTKSLYAVPSYICNGHFLGSRDGILVSKKELEDFLSQNK